MAEHTLAILVKAVGTAQAARNLKGVDAAVSSIGAKAGKGLRTAASNMLKLGAAAGAVGVGLGAMAVKSGVQSLATLESAITSVDGALQTVSKTYGATGANVAAWANEIEASIGAAFDDKDITAATATLIRFGKVGGSNLRPAMVAMTNLAAKTGSVDSAANLLSKALADPTKAAGKLARQGIVLTKAQQAQIKAFVKAGKVGQAQKVILDAVAKSTAGAAAATQGPYQRAMSTFGDVTEDAQRALAEGFLPVLTRAADWMKTKLADPATMNSIRTLGQNLAGAFDKALTFVEGIDWASLGAGLKVAADWAGRLFGAFMSLPPEVKGTILALAGLDKLSGGAVSGITKELASGLIKGVLGMTAGVVNINAGVVNGGGAGNILGDAAGAAGKGGLATAVLSSISSAAAVGVGTFLAGLGISAVIKENSGMSDAQWQAQVNSNLVRLGGQSQSILNKVSAPPPLPKGTAENDPTGFKNSSAGAAILKTLGDTHSEQLATTRGIEAVKGKQAESIIAFRAGERATQTAGMTTANASRMAGAQSAMATFSSASRIVSAISSIRPTVNVTVTVPGASVNYGSPTGSAGGGGQTQKPR